MPRQWLFLFLAIASLIGACCSGRAVTCNVRFLLAFDVGLGHCIAGAGSFGLDQALLNDVAIDLAHGGELLHCYFILNDYQHQQRPEPQAQTEFYGQIC